MQKGWFLAALLLTLNQSSPTKSLEAHNIFFQQLDLIFNNKLKNLKTKSLISPDLTTQILTIEVAKKKFYLENKTDTNKRQHKAAAAVLKSAIRQVKFHYYNNKFEAMDCYQRTTSKK